MDLKLAKWLRWLPTIREQIEVVVIAKHIFKEVQSAIANNPALHQPSSFYEFLAQAYASHAVIGLRRQLKSDDNSISIAGLLKEMIANPQVVTRSYYVGLYRHGSVVEQFADKDFERFAEASALHVDASRVSADLAAFVAACARCEKFADRRIAHWDRRARRDIPTFNEVDECIDLLDRLYVKYHSLFTAEGIETLLPTWQYDWQQIFRVPWIPDQTPEQSRLG